MSESPPADPDWYYEKDNRLPVPLDVDEAACTSCGLTLTKGQQSFKFDRFSKSTNEPMNYVRLKPRRFLPNNSESWAKG